MDEFRCAELKEKICEELASLEVQLLQLAESSRPVAPDNAIGRITRMDAMQSQAMNESSFKSAKQRKSLLEDALGRISEDENFGKCRQCGGEIPFPRLLFLPDTKTCVACARC